MVDNNQTTNQTTRTAHNEKSRHRAAIIGGTAGGVIALILVVLALGYIRYRRQSQNCHLDSDGSEIHAEAVPFPASESPRTILTSKTQGATSRPVATPSVNNPTIDVLNGREGSTGSRVYVVRPHFESLLVEVEDLRREVQVLRAGQVEPPPTYCTT